MKSEILKSVGFLVLLVFSGSAAALAKPAGTAKTPKVDPVKTQNDRQKTQHSNRKLAAQHLRADHQQELQARLHQSAGQHKGYSGQGRANAAGGVK